MAGPTVVISVLADTKKAASELNGFGSKFQGFAKIAGAAILATSVIVAGFLATSIKAAGEAQKITAQTAAVLQSTQGIAGQTAESVGRLSSSLSRLSGIDDELIQKGANVLLTFTNIRGVNFDAATKSALNMSVALGQDLQSASTLVGKALNDPIQGLSALTRVGVGFTEQQKAQITAMQEAGDVAGAQAVILAELERQFGGSAEAFGNTFQGSIGKVQTAFGNLQESIGNAFLPVLTTAFGKVAELLTTIGESPAFNAILTGISTFVAGLFDGTGAAGQFAEAFRVISTVLSPFGLVLQALLPVLPSLQAAFQGLATALGGALMAVLPALSTLLDAVIGALSGVLAAVLPVVITLVTQLANTFAKLAPILTPIITLLAEILGEALAQLAPLIAMVAEALGGILGAALEAIVPLFEGLAPVVMAVLEAISPLISIVLSLVTPFLSLLEPIGMLIGALLPPLIELLLATSPVIQLLVPILNLLTPVLQFIADGLAAVVGWVTEAISAFVALVTGSDDATAKVQAVWQKMLDFFRGIPKAIGDFFSGAANWLRDAGRAIIQGLLDGITSMIGRIGDVVGGVMDFVSGFFPRSPAKRGPFSGSGWTALRNAGRAITEQFNAGVLSGQNFLDVNLGTSLRASAGPAFAAAGGGSAGSGVPAVHIHLDGQVYMTQAEVGRAIKDALDEYFRLNGDR